MLKEMFGDNRFTVEQIKAEFQSLFKKPIPQTLLKEVQRLTNTHSITIKEAIRFYMEQETKKADENKKKAARTLAESESNSSNYQDNSLWTYFFLYMMIADDSVAYDSSSIASVSSSLTNDTGYLLDSLSESKAIPTAYEAAIARSDSPSYIPSDSHSYIADTSGSVSRDSSGSGSGDSSGSGSGDSSGSGSGSGSGCSGSGSGCSGGS